MENLAMRGFFLVACLLALIAGNAAAQTFPSKSITLICPYPQAGAGNQYLREFAQIASKYLGQPITVENKPGELASYGPAWMARTASPDGYTLAMLTITSFRVPHMTRVTWDPTKDFTYIIGLADFNHGLAVKSDSQFKSLKDLIDHAKTNPGSVRYSAPVHGFTSHLLIADLEFKTGIRLLLVPSGVIQKSAAALIDGHIMAISETLTDLRPYLDAGVFRLLVTFGDRRSRWSAPTAAELGLDIFSYTPFGIVGPKGMDPKLVKVLHDAFNRTLDDSAYDELVKRLEIVDLYKSSEDYAEWAIDQFRFQRRLIERTIGLGRGWGNK